MYHSEAIVLAVEKALRLKPASYLGEIAECLRVDRHTIARAMKSRGLSFRELRGEIILNSAHFLLTGAPPRSRKEVACLLGFTSQSAFSHFMKRHFDARDNPISIPHATKAISIDHDLRPTKAPARQGYFA